MSGIIIYHNPDCSKSRATLELLRQKGHEPQVVDYLQVGWTRELLWDLSARTGLQPRELLRDDERAAELGLSDPSTSDEAIVAAMILDPALVNRPIVTTPKGAALCRPAELVLALL